MLKSLSDKIEQHSQNFTKLVNIINKLSNAVDEGFEEVNIRLSRLEGSEGMKGVHSQLGDIKNDLKKINSVTRYEDEAGNFDLFKNKQGEA